MTQNVQGDVLFFNACFYSIVAVAGKNGEACHALQFSFVKMTLF